MVHGLGFRMVHGLGLRVSSYMLHRILSRMWDLGLGGGACQIWNLGHSKYLCSTSSHCKVGAFIIRIGFWGPLCYNYNT